MILEPSVAVLFLSILLVFQQGQVFADSISSFDTLSDAVAAVTVIPPMRRLTATNYTRCPNGFVLPPNPSDSEIEWVENTNCALACKSPIFDDSSWDDAMRFMAAVTTMGLGCLCLMLISMLIGYVGTSSAQQRDINVVTLAISLFSFVPTVVSFIQRLRPFEDQFCRDSAVPLSAEDGFTLCALESWVNMYCGFGLALAWAVQSFQIMRAVTFRVKLLRNNYAAAVLFLFPLVINVVAFSSGSQGYSRGNFSCFTNTHAGNDDIYYFFVPIFAVGCVGVVCMVLAIYSIVRLLQKSKARVLPTLNRESPGASGRGDNSSSADVSGDEMNQQQLSGALNGPSLSELSPQSSHAEMRSSLFSTLRTLYLPISFVVFFLFCMFGLVLGRAEVWSLRNERKRLFDVWVDCVFLNYDGTDDSSWLSSCGSQPDDAGLDQGLGIWFGLAAMGHGIFVAVSFMRYKQAYKVLTSLCGLLVGSLQTATAEWDRSEAVSYFVEFEAEQDQPLSTRPSESRILNATSQDAEDNMMGVPSASLSLKGNDAENKYIEIPLATGTPRIGADRNHVDEVCTLADF